MRKFLFLQAMGVLIATCIFAESLGTPGFSLAINENKLFVQLDLSELISSETLMKIKQGIGELWGVEMKLQTPKRFFGYSNISNRQLFLKLDYKMVTDAFVLITSFEKQVDTSFFSDSSAIEPYFRDSVFIPMVSLDSVRRDKEYRLYLKFTAISLTDINLGASDPSSNNSVSPLEFLFQKFLGLINYGKSEQEFWSESFTLDSVPTKP
jgi:hypothetical protein